MRNQFLAFVLCTAVATAFYAAAAFNAASTSARTVEATVVGDASSYLKIAVNSTNENAPFVTTEGAIPKIKFTFGTVGGVTGTGVNPDSTYYFDDIVRITNQGTTDVSVQVNSTASEGSLKVCYMADWGNMHNGCYTTTSTALTLPVGGTDYLGLSVNVTGVSGSAFTGSLYIVASRP